MKETIKTRELPQGARTHIDGTIDGKPFKNKEVWFKKMDGMYGQWFDEDGEMFVFNAEFEKKGKFYKIVQS